MSEIELKPCPFCGAEAKVTCSQTQIVGCTDASCIIIGFAFPADKWNERKFSDFEHKLAAIVGENKRLREAAKPYTYIGKDGKAVLARDLEDKNTELSGAVLDMLSDMKARMDVGHGMCDGRKDDGAYIFPFGNGVYTRLMTALGNPDIEPSQGLADNEAKDKEISDLQQRIANGMKENMRLAGETVLKDKRIEELEEAIRVASECEVSKVFPFGADAFGPPGWEWTHPNGCEWSGITDGKDYPPLHPLLRQALKGDT